MIKCLKLFIVIVLVVGSSYAQSNPNDSSLELQKIINSYQDHKGYDANLYPLGLFTKGYYKADAEFANSKLEELSKIKVDDLEESDRISAELLKFVLQDKIDFYVFERYLNPLLSDSGFHSSLNYNVKPLHSYNQVKNI